jgi:hypothetical protein
MPKVKRAVLALILAVSFLTPYAFSMELEGVPSSIQSPEDLRHWFKQDFHYKMIIPDKLQSPQETIDCKTGDCEDFASLASAVLAKMGISGKVVVIRFEGLNIMHAVCVWKGEDGTYNFISNKELVYSRETSVESAIKKYYPDCESIENIDSVRGETVAMDWRGGKRSR